MQRHSGLIIDSIENYDVIDCQVCQFKHIVPIPTVEDLEKLYGSQFYAKDKANYFKDAEEDLDWWLETYNNYLKLLAKQVPGRKLLDIGSGPGYFLKAAPGLGWQAVGFEPSRLAYEYSSGKGVEVVNDFFSAKKAKKFGLFDVVCLSLVLEHLPNPVEILQDVKTVLHPGGLVFILSPNDYNPLQKILRENLKFKPWWVAPRHHINYFDFGSIKNLLKKLNFTVVDCLATYPMEFFLLEGLNYVGRRTVGRKCHNYRKAFEINLYRGNPELLNSMYRQLAKHNIGREFVIIARNDKKY